MKKLFTLLALTMSFSMNAQWSYNSSSTGIQSSTNDASGARAIAMGGYTTASGDFTTSMGRYTTASGNRATAMGGNTTASGIYSTAMGYDTTASGWYSTATGDQTTASGDSSTAMGVSTTASGDYTTAMGRGTTASGTDSTAMGYYTQASGSRSTAMGRSTTASDYASTVIGQYNSSGSTTTTSSTAFNTSNTAFVIGNGTLGNLSDAFKVMFNGDASVSNNLTVMGDLEVQSDARLKSNIVSLGPTLNKLLQIDGKSYEMKGKKKIGVLAQEIQKLFPELVGADDKNRLTVNYQGLVPVLINALKEQQNEIVKLKEQEKRIERLEKLIANIN